ncbi:MAG: ABC transporter permease [Candidatus Izemoplasmatales bacterium]
MNEIVQKVLLFSKKHIYEIVISFITLILVFFLPKWTYQDETLTQVNYGLLVILILQYVVYFIWKKRKEAKLLQQKEEVKDITSFLNVSGSIIAIIFGILFGFVVMMFTNPPQALEGIIVIIQGGFNEGMFSLGNMIYYAVPVILTGLSVAFAFRTGLFNIGATGQLTVGAFFAVYVGVKWGFLSSVPLLHWLTALIVGGIAGGLWGAIPGFLKAYRNVNEVVSSIMLNYIGMYLNSILIKKLIYNVTYARAMSILPSAETPTFNLDYLFPNSSVNAGIVVAIIIVITLHIVLNKTTFGYELKAVGFNRHASRYAGINEKRNIVLSMIISGAVAGIAGALIFLIQGKNMKPENILLQEGFTGIAISLLGLNSPFGVLFAGLFYGSLYQGGYYLQTLDFNDTIIDIIIGVVIYASALSLAIQALMKYFIDKFRKKKAKAEQGGETS